MTLLIGLTLYCIALYVMVIGRHRLICWESDRAVMVAYTNRAIECLGDDLEGYYEACYARNLFRNRGAA